MVTSKTLSPRSIAAAVLVLIATPIIAASPSCAQGQLRESASNRTVRVGFYENEPKVFTSKAGRPSGIFIEILEDIARREQWDLDYVPCEWAKCLDALEEGRIDLMPDVAFSAERSKRFDFNEETVVDSWSQVYAVSKKPMSKLSDLNGLRVGLLKGSIQQTVLEQMIKGFGYHVPIVEAHSYEEVFTLATTGTVDAVVTNQLFGDYHYQQYGLVRTGIVFNSVSLHFATARGTNQDLLDAIDHELRAMKSEPGSVFYTELALWTERPPKVVLPRHLAWIMGGIGGFLVLAFGVIVVLRRQVRLKTRYLVQANETLRESEEKFRSLFQNHSAVKLIIDPADGRIVEANGAAEKFYGWSGEQLRRMRIQDINTSPPERIEAEMEMARVGERGQFEFRHRLADGSVRDVEVRSSRIDIRGRAVLHSIIHDITEHRKLEAQYRQSQKMEAVGLLAGGVAHDYNNMLGVILGHAELALRRVDPTESLHADLDEIFNAAARSADLTRQLLAFARRQTINPVTLDLNQAVESMLRMLQRLIAEDIHVAWLPGVNLSPVMMDPVQLSQLLLNLCVNARDSIVGGGTITIQTRNTVLDGIYCAEHVGAAAGEYVMLTVGDDGSGMDKETLGQIFEPFFTTKGEGRGTGLGLSTVYGIVKQNHGFIDVDSEPGKGTIFSIYLPRCAGQDTSDEREENAELPSGGGETVLLVEDEPMLLTMGTMMLEQLGYRVLAASRPSEALRLSEEHGSEIRLLVTDVIMPEMNGRALGERLRTLHPAMPILFVSGHTADVIAQDGVLDEGVNFLQKPFSMQDLAVKVREAVRSAGGG